MVLMSGPSRRQGRGWFWSLTTSCALGTRDPQDKPRADCCLSATDADAASARAPSVTLGTPTDILSQHTFRGCADEDGTFLPELPGL